MIAVALAILVITGVVVYNIMRLSSAVHEVNESLGDLDTLKREFRLDLARGDTLRARITSSRQIEMRKIDSIVWMLRNGY